MSEHDYASKWIKHTAFNNVYVVHCGELISICDHDDLHEVAICWSNRDGEEFDDIEIVMNGFYSVESLIKGLQEAKRRIDSNK
jgi:hypothetical protein